MPFTEIIPLTRLPRKTATFTYKVPSNMEGLISIGQFVEIPFRKRLLRGIVAEIHDRQPSFDRIASISDPIEETPSWTKQHIDSLLKCAAYYHCSPATFALSFTPDIPKRLQEVPPDTTDKQRLPDLSIDQTVTIPTESSTIKFQRQAERLAFYKQLCESTDKQILILCPQQIDVDEIAYYLSLHIDKVVAWNNKDNKNKQWHKWQQIRDDKARIIVATRSGVFLPAKNLDAIVIDQSDRPDHKSWASSPYYDSRFCANDLAKQLNIPVYQLSLNPPLSQSPTFSKRLSEVKAHIPSSTFPLTTIFHNRTNPILHPSVLDSIKAGPLPIIVMTHRSHARTLRCLDCHQQWRCGQCSSNLACLDQYLMCPNCQKKYQVPTTCPKCQSQRIKEFGIGVEGMAEKLTTLFPDKVIQTLTGDTDTLPLPADMLVSTGYVWKRILQNVEQAIGPVILYRPESILFTPDYRANEHFYHFINWHRSIAKDYFDADTLVQTALKDDDPLYQLVIADDYAKLSRQELVSRIRYLYPPYSTIYKIILKKQDAQFHQNIRAIHEALSVYNSVLGPRYAYKKQQVYAANWLVKIRADQPANLDKILKSLYSKVIIDINPHSLS